METTAERRERELAAAREASKVKRYVLVVYVPKYDYYEVLGANQGHLHYDDPKVALNRAELLKPSLKAKLKIEPEWVKVICWDCWGPGGDCCGSVFSVEDVEESQVRQ